MFRKLAGRILGFDDQIKALQEKVKELSWDTAYGMWTRGAFLQFCQVMPRGERTVVFIDFDEIHIHNQEHGYTEVDCRIQASFSVPFRSSDVVARWYSGDEMVILFDGDRDFAEGALRQLEASSRQNGLMFKYEIGSWEVGKQPIEEVVEELSNKLAMLKSVPR